MMTWFKVTKWTKPDLTPEEQAFVDDEIPANFRLLKEGVPKVSRGLQERAQSEADANAAVLWASLTDEERRAAEKAGEALRRQEESLRETLRGG